MQRRRPGMLTTIAVLNMVFGSLGLICACINGFGIGLLLTASRDNPNPAMRILAEAAELLQREVPGYLTIEITRTLYFLVFSTLLLVAGIGLLYISNWARIISFIYAIVTILTQVAFLLYLFLVVYPAVARIQAQFGGDPLEGKLSQIAGLAGIGLVIIYAIVLLILLCTPTVSTAFSRQPTDDYEQGGYEGYDEYESGRT